MQKIDYEIRNKFLPSNISVADKRKQKIIEGRKNKLMCSRSELLSWSSVIENDWFNTKVDFLIGKYKIDWKRLCMSRFM